MEMTITYPDGIRVRGEFDYEYDGDRTLIFVGDDCVAIEAGRLEPAQCEQAVRHLYAPVEFHG